TEQGFTEARGSMFAGGYGSGGRDRFDTTSEGYRFVKEIAAMRASERELSHGKVRVLKDATSTGVLAYTVTWNTRTALVVFNTSTHNLLADNLGTDLPEGTVLKRVGGMNLPPESGPWSVGAGGVVHGRLAPRSAIVLAATVKEASEATVTPGASVAISSPNNAVYSANVPVAGTVPLGVGEPKLVV